MIDENWVHFLIHLIFIFVFLLLVELMVVNPIASFLSSIPFYQRLFSGNNLKQKSEQKFYE